MQKIFIKFRNASITGMGLGFGLFVSYLLAVSVGTLNTFSTGNTVSSSQVNNNFTTLKTAIEDLNTEVQALAIVPTGTILPYAGNTAPTGFLICNGNAVSRTTYANLFSTIGTTWGSGDGSTTFNLPDGRAAAPVGAGTSTKYTQNETLSLGSNENDQLQNFSRGFETTDYIWSTTGGSSKTYLFFRDQFNNHSPSSSTDAIFVANGDSASSNGLGLVYIGPMKSNGTHGTPRNGYVTKGKQFIVNFIIKD
ncbi:MAG: phage tail protein [Spirochaetota bacterium]